MKKLLSFILCIMMVFQSALAAGNMRILKNLKEATSEISLDSSESTDYEIIVKFKSATEDTIKEIPRLKGYRNLFDNLYLLWFEDAHTAKVICDYLNSDPNVEFSHPNEEITLPIIEGEEAEDNISDVLLEEADSTYPNDYDTYPGEYFLKSINAKEAWDKLKALSSSSQNSAVVAVLDSGVDLDNPDLVNRFYRDSSDNIIGKRLLGDGLESFDDDFTEKYHGTSVAGVIAAQANNGVGICGVSGEFDVKIMPVKVFNSTGSAYISGIMEGIKFAADNGANVINLSFGSIVHIDGLQEAIDYAYNKGVTVVCSAGNKYSNQYLYPSCLKNVISVASLGETNEKSYFSQFNEYIDVSAPGENLALTYPTSNVKEGRNGTSFSAPMVAAAAALLKIANPFITPSQIEEILKATATDLGREGYDIEYGFGKINLLEAIKKSNTGYVATTSIVTTEKLTVEVNKTKQIDVTVNPENANNKTVVYYSKDSSVATVSNSGVVMGVTPGETTIYVISNFDNNLKSECVVTVLPTNLDFTSMPVDLGTNNQEMPNTDSTEFIFSSDVDYGGKSASVYRIYQNGSTTSLLKKAVNNAYQYAEYLPKNATSTVEEENQFAYVFLLDTPTSASFIGAKTDYFTKSPSQPQSATIPGWDSTKDFVAFATDGAGFNIFTSDNKLHYRSNFDTSSTDNIDDKYQNVVNVAFGYYKSENEFVDYNVIDAIYNDAKDVYAYVVLAQDDAGSQTILTSTYGGKTWANSRPLSSETYPKFNQIIADGNYLYLLSATSVYYMAMQRTTSGAVATSSPKKLCDIDSSKITKLSLLTNGQDKVLAGYGSNGIYAITNDGSVTELYTANGKNISMAFNFNGSYWAMIDNVLHKAAIPTATDFSLDDKLDIFNINLLNSERKLIDSIPENGKVTVEYYMESTAPIDIEFTTMGQTVSGKYPLQIVTSLYNADTNALIDVKRKNLTVDYYNITSNGILYKIGSILRWEETFDLNPDINYKIKVMTFKGHGFNWTEPGNNAITLDVFSKALEK